MPPAAWQIDSQQGVIDSSLKRVTLHGTGNILPRSLLYKGVSRGRVSTVFVCVCVCISVPC